MNRTLHAMHDCGSFNDQSVSELISELINHFNNFGEVLESFEDEGFLNSIHQNLPENRKELLLEIIRRHVSELKAANPNQTPDKGEGQEDPEDDDDEDMNALD